jgi:predicted transposase YdaD
MPLRVRAYTALAEEKYELPVYPVLINILPHVKDPQIPNRYESEFNGIRALQEYRVINLWEVDVNLVFEQNIRTLLPFVPILKGGGEEQIVRQALRELRADEELSELESLLSFFSTFVLELPVVQEIMRWDMTVLRESPLAQELFREGQLEGQREGRVEGQLEGELTLVLRQLARRVGTLDESLVQRVRGLSLEELERLGEALLDFSDVSDLQGWLADLTA